MTAKWSTFLVHSPLFQQDRKETAQPKISCSSQEAYIPLSYPCSTGIRVRYKQLKLEILSKGNSAFVYKGSEIEVVLLFIAFSGFFSGLLAMSQVSEWGTGVYEVLMQQGPDLDP